MIIKVFKATLWLLLSLITIILLVIGLLRLPAVQDRLTSEIEKSLSDQLETEVRVGRIGIDFPKMLTIYKVDLETPAGDSLFNLGKLGIDINMLHLLQKEVVIQKVKIEDIFAQVIITDSTSNIQFLLDAFSDQAPSTDSPEPSSSNGNAGWAVKFPTTALELRRADLYYQNDPNGILMDGKLNNLSIRTNRVDLDQQLYAIEAARIDGGQVLLIMNDTVNEVDTADDESTPFFLQLSSRELTITNTAFDFQSKAMDLSVALAETRLLSAELSLQDALQFKVSDFSLRDGNYVMNLPASTLSNGFDPNHLNLQNISIQAKDIQYDQEAIVAQIDQVRAVAKNGIALQELSGNINYQSDQLNLYNLFLKTANSEVDIPQFAIDYNFQKGFGPKTPFKVSSIAQASIGVSDLLYFIPQLDTLEVLAQNREQQIKFELKAEGNQQLLNLERIFLNGPGIQLRGNGRVKQLLNPEAIAGNFQLNELAVVPSSILPLFPDSLLPQYIQWPQRIQIDGSLNYKDHLADFKLRAVEQRDSNPINSVVAINGKVQDILQYPATTVDLLIDTMQVTRYSALAYLPEGSIPEGYQLPDFLKVAGAVQGPLNKLDINIKLATESDRTNFAVAGQVRQVLAADSLSFDLQIPNLIVDIPELREILPDSTLPSDLNFPDFRIANGRVNGNPQDINIDLPFTTINGEGVVAGTYTPENFSIITAINGFQPEKLFRGARADSLVLLALDPLSLELNASGQLEPALDASLNLTISEGNKGALLQLEGTAQRDTFSGVMTFSHSDLQGSASGTYLQKDSLHEINGKVRINRADLKRWRLSDRPLYLSGQSSFSSKGLTPENISARLSLNDILLRSDTSSAFIDTLFAYAEMHQGNNEIEIFSDLLNFSLEGSFRPSLVFGEINRFLQAYWREDISQPDPVVYGNYMNAYLEIRNPRPLTSGIIPGLRALSPMTANFIYREQDPELLVTASLPFLNYAGINMDSLELNARGNTKHLQYQADWKNINLFDQVILGRTQIEGENTDKALDVNFRVWSQKQDPRHHIRMEIDPEPDSLSIQLADRQLIDNIDWTIPADNQLLFAGQRVAAQNWQLSYQDQKITIRTPGPKELLLALQGIDLAPFGSLIRSEEEIVVGVMDGDVKVNDLLGQMKFDAQFAIEGLSVYNQPWGDLSMNIANQKKQIYRLDLQLEKAENDLSVAGTIIPGGALDLQIDIGALQLQSIEPLSMGYLSNTQGYAMGELAISGSFDEPTYQGELQLMNAALDIDLLNTRFQIENEPIHFNGQRITIDNLSFFDPQNNEAVLKGMVIARSLSDYQFDLSVRARDFLVLNTTKEDNPLYYGYLRTDADIQITGDVFQPELEVTASPKKNSTLTYNLVQDVVPQTESRAGVVRFVESYEWQQTMIADSLQQKSSGPRRGFDLTTNLNINPDLKFTVIIDPVTGDQFTGRGEGDIVFRQFSDGKMEMTGRVEMVEGLYDFTYQGLISRQFTVEPESSINWQGDPMNPALDLSISSYIQTAPYPLVSEFVGSTESNLRRRQTFAVRMYLEGTLESMQVNTDILYPEDIPGNSGLPAIEESLSLLRTDQSQLNTQAFGLLLFKGFVNFGDSGTSSGGSIDNSVQSGLDNVLTQQLNNLANRYIGFVELDFGMESFSTDAGGRQRDLRLSLRKRLFNNRLIISVDGVTQTGETDPDNTLPQTYLDNLTAELLLSKNGRFRLKVFSNRELDQFTTGDVVRIGGHLAFSKDFDRFFWSTDKRPAKDPASEKPIEDDPSRNGEQKMKIQEE